MPNHVINKIIIKKLTPAQVNTFIEKYTVEANDLRIIDFDKIIPEPRDIRDCPKDCIVNKDSHIEEDKDRPWFDWYTWRNKYWNTKWGAYDGETIHTDHTVTLWFQTAWCPPTPIYQKLAEIGYELEVKWADENYGENCGKAIYKPSEQRWNITKANEMGNPVLFASKLWNS